MKTAKRTYTLPIGTLKRFEQEIAPELRSAKVAELIEGWLHERECELLRQDIIEGCREMSEIYLEVAREWEKTDDALWRSLET